MNKALNYLGIARKAGFLAIGEEATGICARAGKARLIILAADASDNARRRAEGFSRDRTILLPVPFTKLELSNILGKTGCSMVAFTDLGLALHFAESLQTALPESTVEAAIVALQTKHTKLEKRRKETIAHSKNKKQGKKKRQESFMR